MASELTDRQRAAQIRKENRKFLNRDRKRLKAAGFTEKVIRGRGRTYGAVYTRSDLPSFYTAWRIRWDTFCNGTPCPSDAIRQGVAAWALDYELLVNLHSDNVRVVGIWNYQENRSHWTTVEKFLKEGRRANYDARGGSDQLYLPWSKFERDQPFLAPSAISK